MKVFLRLSKLCLFVMLAGIALAGCKKSGETAKPITIKVGCVMAASHPTTVAMQEVFKKMVEQETNGAILVNVYEAGLLGGEKDLYNSVKSGSLEVVTMGTGMWDEFNKMLIPDWPFLFRDLKHARKVFTGEIGAEISNEFNQNVNAYMIGGWGPNGARTFSSNKPLNTPADFKGQRIRMPNNPIHLKLAELLGANVISMNMNDIFSALEQKVIDGQDNGMSQIRATGWYEVQKYIYETNHMVSSIEILVSKKFMDSLSPENRAIIEKAAVASTEYAWDLYEASIDNDRKFLQDNGLTIVQPTAADKEEMIMMMAPLYADLQAKYPWAEELTQRIRGIE